MEFDSSCLPRRPLLDTDVFLFGIGRNVQQANAALCRAFFLELQEAKRDILLAAPSLAEMFSGGESEEVAHTPLVEVVDFDRFAAAQFATALPRGAIQALRSSGVSQPRSGIKFDAMIAACAKRHRADALVTMNITDFARYEEILGLRVVTPSAFLAAQRSLKLSDRKPPDPPATM